MILASAGTTLKLKMYLVFKMKHIKYRFQKVFIPRGRQLIFSQLLPVRLEISIYKSLHTRAQLHISYTTPQTTSTFVSDSPIIPIMLHAKTRQTYTYTYLESHVVSAKSKYADIKSTAYLPEKRWYLAEKKKYQTVIV